MPKHKFIVFIAIIFLLLASSLIGCGASDAGDIVSGQSTVEQETSADVSTESAQELTQKQDKQGDLGKSEAGSDERDTQENSETSETVSETEQDCEELSVDAYVDGSFNQDIKDIEYLDGKLFFTVTDLTYSFEDSIGWRDGYVRGRTATYYKDMESREIRLLYEY